MSDPAASSSQQGNPANDERQPDPEPRSPTGQSDTRVTGGMRGRPEPRPRRFRHSVSDQFVISLTHASSPAASLRQASVIGNAGGSPSNGSTDRLGVGDDDDDGTDGHSAGESVSGSESDGAGDGERGFRERMDSLPNVSGRRPGRSPSGASDDGGDPSTPVLVSPSVYDLNLARFEQMVASIRGEPSGTGNNSSGQPLDLNPLPDLGTSARALTDNALVRNARTGSVAIDNRHGLAHVLARDTLHENPNPEPSESDLMLPDEGEAATSTSVATTATTPTTLTTTDGRTTTIDAFTARRAKGRALTAPSAAAPAGYGTQTRVDKQGWLTKLGARYKTWRRRWFVLQDSFLLYWKSPKRKKLLGVINLEDVSDVSAADSNATLNPRKRRFSVPGPITEKSKKRKEKQQAKYPGLFKVVTEGRTYLLRPDNPAETPSWLRPRFPPSTCSPVVRRSVPPPTVSDPAFLLPPVPLSCVVASLWMTRERCSCVSFAKHCAATPVVSALSTARPSIAIPPLKCGTLLKRGQTIKTWKARWFELRGMLLLYYESGKKKDHVVGLLHLEDCEVRRADGEVGPDLCLKLTTSYGRVLYASTRKGESVIESWISAISETKDYITRYRLRAMQRGEPLTRAVWNASVDDFGAVADEVEVYNRVFYGGVDPGMRATIWPFLLRVFDFKSLAVEREAKLALRTEEYEALRDAWQARLAEIGEADSGNVGTPVAGDAGGESGPGDARGDESQLSPEDELLVDIVRRVEVDIPRTDPGEPFFRDHAENRAALRALCVTFALDSGIGYCQGMGDVLSPLFYVLRSEPLAYFCFKNICFGAGREEGEYRHAPQFLGDSEDVFAELRDVLGAVDPALLAYFKSIDCDHLYFAKRWFHVLFKREFAFHDVLTLWEVMWAAPMTAHFHVYIAAAILWQQRHAFMRAGMDYGEIMMHVNRLGAMEGELAVDVHVTLMRAEAMFYKLGARTDDAPLEEGIRDEFFRHRDPAPDGVANGGAAP